MTKVIDLMNTAKTKLKATSNYQLAKLTGIPEQRISGLYKGSEKPTDEALARLALAIDKPIGEVLAEVRAEDAKTEKSRAFWRDFLSATEGLKQTSKLAILCASWWLGSLAGSATKCAECGFTLNRRARA